MSKYPDFKNDPDYEWKFIFKRTQEFIRELVTVTLDGWNVVYPVQDSFGSMQATIYRKKPTQDVSEGSGQESNNSKEEKPIVDEQKEEDKPSDGEPSTEKPVEDKPKTRKRTTKANNT